MHSKSPKSLFVSTCSILLTKYEYVASDHHLNNNNNDNDNANHKSVSSCLETIFKMEDAIKNAAAAANGNLHNNYTHTMNSTTTTTSPYGSTIQKCIGCYQHTQAECPTNPQIPCQHLIDELYRNCDGVALPDGYYYNPPVS